MLIWCERKTLLANQLNRAINDAVLTFLNNVLLEIVCSELMVLFFLWDQCREEEEASIHLTGRVLINNHHICIASVIVYVLIFFK